MNENTTLSLFNVFHESFVKNEFIVFLNEIIPQYICRRPWVYHMRAIGACRRCLPPATYQSPYLLSTCHMPSSLTIDFYFFICLLGRLWNSIPYWDEGDFTPFPDYVTGNKKSSILIHFIRPPCIERYYDKRLISIEILIYR